MLLHVHYRHQLGENFHVHNDYDMHNHLYTYYRLYSN